MKISSVRSRLLPSSWENPSTPLPILLLFLWLVLVAILGRALVLLGVPESILIVVSAAGILIGMPISWNLGTRLEKAHDITYELIMRWILVFLSLLLAWGLWRPFRDLVVQASIPAPSVTAIVVLLAAVGVFLRITLPRLPAWLRRQ